MTGTDKPSIRGATAFDERNPSLTADSGGAGAAVATAGDLAATSAVEREVSATEQRLIDLDARLLSLQRRIDALQEGYREFKELPGRLTSEISRLSQQINSLR